MEPGIAQEGSTAELAGKRRIARVRVFCFFQRVADLTFDSSLTVARENNLKLPATSDRGIWPK